MVAKVSEYEDMIKADGGGAFDHIEYDGERRVILRSSFLKTADLSGSVRFYFDARREEVVTGRKFDPVSGQWLLRPGSVYRVYTNVVVTEPLPEGVRIEVIPTDDAADVMVFSNPVLYSGFEGRVYFTVMPFRRVSLDEMVSLARMSFIDEGVQRATKSGSKSGTKSGNSTRRKKKTDEAPEVDDAGLVSDEQSESEEA